MEIDVDIKGRCVECGVEVKVHPATWVNAWAAPVRTGYCPDCADRVSEQIRRLLASASRPDGEK